MRLGLGIWLGEPFTEGEEEGHSDVESEAMKSHSESEEGSGSEGESEGEESEDGLGLTTGGVGRFGALSLGDGEEKEEVENTV